jgi:hypothetical protein
MAIIQEPLSKEEFQSLKGTVDFYYWKGILCARMYPQNVKQPGTPAQQLVWEAQRNRWIDARRLSEEDKRAWKRLCGSSALTWIDTYGSQYLKGYSIRGRRPPVFSNCSLNVSEGQVVLCIVCSEPCEVRIYWTRKKLEQRELNWEWIPQLESPVPPQCYPRVKLYEYWDNVNTQRYREADALQCFTIDNNIQGSVLRARMKVMTTDPELELATSGIYSLAPDDVPS